jgi:tetratricopeptide (TPR) repeat protein
MLRVARVVLVAVLTASGAWAQGAAGHVAAGDRLLAALDAHGALREYEAALADSPTHYDALCKASRSAVDLGEFEPDATTRARYFATGRAYGQRAVAANPRDATGHFALARATGRAALAVSSRERVNYGKLVRSEALAALAIAPDHPGALHVMGMWNAEVMRLPGMLRFIARRFLGGEVFGEASWQRAQQYLERAVAIDPDRIVHHLDLGLILKDRGDTAGARAQFDWIARAPVSDVNDRNYKVQAANERRKL